MLPEFWGFAEKFHLVFLDGACFARLRMQRAAHVRAIFLRAQSA